MVVQYCRPKGPVEHMFLLGNDKMSFTVYIVLDRLRILAVSGQGRNAI